MCMFVLYSLYKATSSNYPIYPNNSLPLNSVIQTDVIIKSFQIKTVIIFWNCEHFNSLLKLFIFSSTFSHIRCSKLAE